ncbi:MAG: D-alanyl-D-alanine carboxypeptidase family protein [Bacillota bacterium]|jgi:D-alanyl-D-alanine carboxypeptidase (penicillin-binding protein 5/6)
MIHQKANKKLITITWLVVAVLAFSLWTPPIMAAEVPLEADSAILIEASTGQVLYDKNSHQAQAPASVTKLMTLVVAFEAIENGKGELSDKVVTSENAWRLGGSQIYLEPGEEMTLEELLIAIAVGSANDACVAVAEHLFGTHEEFVEVMNEKARELGLKNTHFVNSYGLPAEGHYSSPYDMAQISRYALRFPKLLEMTSIKEYDLRGGEFHLYNTNKLLWWYKGADGFKTGWTNEARYCLASTAERDGLRLIAVVFGSPQRHGNFRDCMKLLNYGFAQYAFKTVAEAGQTCGVVNVGKGAAETVEVVVSEPAGALITKGQDKGITSRVELPESITAPISQGQKLGELVICQGEEELSRFDLLAKQDVAKGSLSSQIGKTFNDIIQLDKRVF